jgi:hypothetical protein
MRRAGLVAARKGGMPCVMDLFHGMGEAEVSETLVSLRGAKNGYFIEDLPFSHSALARLESKLHLPEFREALALPGVDRAGALLVAADVIETAAERAAVRRLEDAAAAASGGGGSSSASGGGGGGQPSHALSRSEFAFAKAVCTSERARHIVSVMSSSSPDPAEALYAVASLGHAALLALCRRPPSKLDDESLAILRLVAEQDASSQVALEQLVPLLPFLDFEPRELVPAVLGPPAVVGGSPEVVVEATFCMVPPAVSALPVDPMPPVFDTATVRKLRSFSADMLSNSLVANILACAHAASASLPVRLGGGTLATLPHSMHLCETYLRGFLRLLGFNAFDASHGLAPILDVAQRLILEDADPSPFGLGSAAASSVDDLFGTFFATLSLRANTFVQNASRPGLIPLVVPGDVTTRRLEHVTKVLDEQRADRALCRLRSSGPTSKPSVASTYPLALAAAASATAKAAAASSGASSRVAATGAPLASSTRAAAAAAPSARAPLHLKAGEYVPAKNVVDGPDSRMFVDAPSTNLVKLGSLAFRRTELVAFISTLGHAPGSYVLSSLLISKRNPEFKDLLRFANVSGGKAPILVPSDNWFKDALSAPFLDTAHSRIQNYQKSFFR